MRVRRKMPLEIRYTTCLHECLERSAFGYDKYQHKLYGKYKSNGKFPRVGFCKGFFTLTFQGKAESRVRVMELPWDPRTMRCAERAACMGEGSRPRLRLRRSLRRLLCLIHAARSTCRTLRGSHGSSITLTFKFNCSILLLCSSNCNNI